MDMPVTLVFTLAFIAGIWLHDAVLDDPKRGSKLKHSPLKRLGAIFIASFVALIPIWLGVYVALAAFCGFSPSSCDKTEAYYEHRYG